MNYFIKQSKHSNTELKSKSVIEYDNENSKFKIANASTIAFQKINHILSKVFQVQ